MKIEEIGKLNIFIADGNYSSKYPRNEEFVKEGIPFIRANNFKNHSIVDDELYFISIEKHLELKKGHLKTGDILITTRGNIGNMAIVPPHHNDSNINAQIVLLRPDQSINNKYLMLILDSPEVQKQISAFTTGTALKQLPIGHLKRVKIPVPSLEKQLHIADVLSKSENLITQRNESIRFLDDFLRSTFIEMFGDPAKNDKGWSLGKFKQLAILDRKQVIPAEFTNEDFYIGLEDIEKETGNIIKTSSEKAEELKSSKFSFTTSHLLYAKLRPYLNKVALPQRGGICSTDIFPILPIEGKSNKYFICYLMRSKPFVTEMHAKSSGANLPRASTSVIENFKAYQPPIVLQNEFAVIAEKTEALKTKYQKSMIELKNLYSSLSQKAFNGELTQQ